MYKWDIYWAKVKYDDKPDQCEFRPVLIIDKDIVLALKMTSQYHEERENDYKIEYWQETGLVKESYVRLDHILTIPINDFGDYIGRLESIDIKNIIEKYKKLSNK